MTEGKRSLALIGFGTSRAEAPWDNPEWAIWTMNDAPTQFAKRSDAHFEMHNADVRRRAYHDTNGRLYLSKLGEIAARTPLYMLTGAEVPGALRYPLDVIVAYFNGDYFASSIDYMFALAIYTAETQPELYDKRIGFWGVEMQQGTEYARERASFEYWWGRAQERGFTLVGGPERPPYRYGYSDRNLERIKTQVKKRQADIQNWIAQMEADERAQVVQLDAVRDRLKEFRGMLRETEWTLQTQTDAPPTGTGPS